MTKNQAMQMALDALLKLGYEASTSVPMYAIYIESIKALREALAQPEPEPFEYWNAVEGWVKIDETRQHFDSVGCGTIYKSAGENRVPLYTAPPHKEWVGLTAYEIASIPLDEHALQTVEKLLKDKNL